MSAVTGQATEAGGTATFMLALLTQPAAAVTVAVSSRDPGEGTASPSSLVFTTGNWNAARTVTVTGADDDVDGRNGDVAGAARPDERRRQLRRHRRRRGRDHHRRRRRAGGDAGAGAVVGYGGRRGVDGDGAAVASVDRGDDGDGGGGGRGERRGGRLHAERGDDADDRGGEHLERRRGDDHGEEQRRGRGRDKTVTVSGSAENDQGIGAVTGRNLTLTDDDEKGLTFVPEETVLATAGSTATYTVALTSMPAGTVTVTDLFGQTAT